MMTHRVIYLNGALFMTGQRKPTGGSTSAIAKVAVCLVPYGSD